MEVETKAFAFTFALGAQMYSIRISFRQEDNGHKIYISLEPLFS